MSNQSALILIPKMGGHFKRVKVFFSVVESVSVARSFWSFQVRHVTCRSDGELRSRDISLAFRAGMTRDANLTVACNMVSVRLSPSTVSSTVPY